MSPSPLSRLLRYVRPHRARLRLAATCSVLNKIFDLAPPLLIGAAVDIVVRREASVFASWGVTDVGAQLWLLGALTLVIWILESAFEYAHAVLWRNLAQTVEHELRLDAYSHVQGLDTAWFEDRGTGSLMAVLNDDVNQLERFLDDGANALLQVATTVVVVGTLFVVIAPEVAWMSLLPMPFIVWGSVRFQRLLEPRYASVRSEAGLLNFQLANNLSGIATIKSFTAEAHEIERMRRHSEGYRQANRAAIALSSAFSPLIRMVIVIGFTAMLVFGGQLALEGKLEAGAHFVQTQPIFEPECLHPFADAIHRSFPEVAVVPMVMPLPDVETAERMERRLAIPIPRAAVGRRAFEQTLRVLARDPRYAGLAVMTPRMDLDRERARELREALASLE